ncbi:MAG: hypothetical protein M1839_003998 [Geoglossum umbratile]|nr:MAG: hypothetical protein M1839_003998 [Geoglossum umbratile]
MHHLDLSGLGGDVVKLLELPRSWGFDLRQRTYSGRSILHSLSERDFDINTLCEILPTFQTVGNDINAWDNQGYSAVDRLYAKWKLMRDRGERSSDDVYGLKEILIWFGATWRIRRGDDTGIFEGDDREGSLASPQLPDETNDGQHYQFSESFEVEYREMLDIVRQSAHEPFLKSRLGRNSLHCLAHVVHLNPDSPANEHSVMARIAESVKRGVDPNSFDRLGETPLHSLLSKPRSNEDEVATEEIVRLLVEMGADMNMRNRDGEVPLHLACKNGLRECVASLLHLSANVHARNYEGRGIIAESRMWLSLSYKESVLDVARISNIESCIAKVCLEGGVEDPTEAQEYCLPVW